MFISLNYKFMVSRENNTNISAKRGGFLEEQFAVGAARLFVLEDGARP